MQSARSILGAAPLCRSLTYRRLLAGLRHRLWSKQKPDLVTIPAETNTSDQLSGSQAAVWAPVAVGRPIDEFEPKPDKNERYVVDTMVDGWATERFVVRAASVRGYWHRYYHGPRQDQFALAVHKLTGTLVIAVADGISSAPHSSLGAALACRYVIDWCRTHLEEGQIAWDTLLRGAAWTLVEYAHSEFGETKDVHRTEELLGTTLTVALVAPHADGTAEVTAAQVGDSDVWLLRRHRYEPVTPHARQRHQDDLIASTGVMGLPRVPQQAEPVNATLAPQDVLLVGTDGFGNALGDGTGLVGQLFATELSAPPRPLRFAHVLDFSRELFDDDRTLVAVWPRTVPSEAK
jgi:serine/threonine protein phosphatase PrpC